LWAPARCVSGVQGSPSILRAKKEHKIRPSRIFESETGIQPGGNIHRGLHELGLTGVVELLDKIRRHHDVDDDFDSSSSRG